ncbi:hypothetical protein BDZ85DRAFT_220985 [Elsinoe ampelina]|uniref:Pre-rRNA-processing protein n=1 Tax=Elsinoe ampelina TaxID=302913 RepID=A0A6A6G911_9PEZI|nr:hypothetical protein BDZ85DRAFT_220985 [Elsinoe ampelina]
MGSSSKRKKEKAKDFQKPKLKVGKARPKATNATNTGFQAKSIVLKQQSLSSAQPSSTDQFNHHLSLLSSKADSQRRDALAALVNSLSANTEAAPPLPAVTVITKVRPLLIDASKTIRSSALELLKLLPVEEVARNVEAVQIYTHIGLTHMVGDTRVSTLDVLEWMLQAFGPATVSCAGGWTGTLKRLLGILGWQTETKQPGSDGAKAWTNISNAKLQDTKSRARLISVLAHFLDTGLNPHDHDREVSSRNRAAEVFPLFQFDAYAIGTTADPYRYLNLFSETETKDDDAIAVADSLSRAEKLGKYRDAIREGVDKAKKEGGEVGRATRKVALALEGAGPRSLL